MDSKHENADRLPGTSTKMTTLDTALRNVRQVQKKTVVFFSLISPKTFCGCCMFLRAANVENGNQVGQVRIGNEFSTMYCMCLRFPLSRECPGAARYPLSCIGSGLGANSSSSLVKGFQTLRFSPTKSHPKCTRNQTFGVEKEFRTSCKLT